MASISVTNFALHILVHFCKDELDVMLRELAPR